MYIGVKFLAMLFAMSMLLLMPLTALATAPVSSGIEGALGIVFVAMHYEDVSDIASVKADLVQNMPALEHVFGQLQRNGLIDSDYPKLIIEAAKYYEVGNRFDTVPTTITFTNSASWTCNNPDVQQFEPMALGPAYVISTTTGLLSYEDLLAMMLLLPQLNEQTSKITVESEQDLEHAKDDPDFAYYMGIEVDIGESGIRSGDLGLSSVWRAKTVHYVVIDEQGGKVADLEPVDNYLAKPSWPPVERADLQGRFVAYSSQQQAIIYDIAAGKSHRIDLHGTALDGSALQRIQFVMHSEQDKVYMLAFAAMGMIDTVYSWDIGTGEWQQEYADLDEWELSDKVWTQRREGIWLDFLEGTPNLETRNIDIIVEEWQPGNQAPEIEEPATQELPVVQNEVQEVQPDSAGGWLNTTILGLAAIALLGFVVVLIKRIK